MANTNINNINNQPELITAKHELYESLKIHNFKSSNPRYSYYKVPRANVELNAHLNGQKKIFITSIDQKQGAYVYLLKDDDKKSSYILISVDKNMPVIWWDLDEHGNKIGKVKYNNAADVKDMFLQLEAAAVLTLTRQKRLREMKARIANQNQQNKARKQLIREQFQNAQWELKNAKKIAKFNADQDAINKSKSEWEKERKKNLASLTKLDWLI